MEDFIKIFVLAIIIVHFASHGVISEEKVCRPEYGKEDCKPEYPTLLPIDKIGPALKGPIHNIALVRVRSCGCPGQLWYFNNGSWLPVNDLRSDNALILGADNQLWFRQADDTCHTFAVVDFVPHYGTPGERVLIAAPEIQSLGKKLVLMVLPKIHPPCLSVRNDITVNVNSSLNQIPVHELVHVKAPSVKCPSSFGGCDWMQEVLQKTSQEAQTALNYFTYDLCIQHIFVALCSINNSVGTYSLCKANGSCFPLTGKNLTYILHVNDSMYFTPQNGFQGKFTAQFTGAYGTFTEKDSMLEWNVPYYALKCYSVLFNIRGYGENEMHVGSVALELLDEENKEFTEENMLEALEKLQNDHQLNETMRRAAASLKNATEDVFALAKLMNITTETMTASRTKVKGRDVVAAAYCKTPIEFTGTVDPEPSSFQDNHPYDALLPTDTLGSPMLKILEKPNDTIAIFSVKSCGCRGQLQSYDPSTETWADVHDVKLDNTLIQGGNNSLRFVQNQPGCHGFAVLKYLAHTGSIGSRVNLSGSSLHSARTFLVFILPRVAEPTLSIKTDIIVGKNSHQNTIRIDDLVQAKTRHIKCESDSCGCHWVLQRMSEQARAGYEYFIKDICRRQVFVALCGISNSSVAIANDSGKVNFINWFGDKITFTNNAKHITHNKLFRNNMLRRDIHHDSDILLIKSPQRVRCL